MKKLADYLDRHKGEDVFIIGAAPSLHYFDNRTLMNRTTICINSALMKIKAPEYYFTSDGFQVYKKHWKIVQEGSFPIIASSQGAMQHITNTGKVDMDRVCSFQKRAGVNIDRNTDALIFGVNSAHCAVHFAHITGAKRIILIGCDCLYEDDKKYFYQFEGEEDDTIEDKYVASKVPKFEQGGQSDGMLEAMLNQWHEIKNANPHLHIEAAGGNIEKVFPKYNND